MNIKVMGLRSKSRLQEQLKYPSEKARLELEKNYCGKTNET